MSFIASHMTSNQEREQLSKIFNELDKDSDGKLSREEIQIGLQTYMSAS